MSNFCYPPLYSGKVSHHMRDSGETNNLLVCHTTHKTCPSICQSHQPSVCHTTNMMCPSICQSHPLSVSHTVRMTCPSVCQPHEAPAHHTTMRTSLSVCQTYIPPVHHTIMMTSPSSISHISHLTIILTPRLVCPYVTDNTCPSVMPST